MTTIPYTSSYRNILNPAYLRTAVRRANRSYSKVIRSTYDGLPAYSLTRHYYTPRYTPSSYTYTGLLSSSSYSTVPRGYARPSFYAKTLYLPPVRHMPPLTYRIPSTYAPAPISSSYRGLSSGPRLWYGSTTPLASRYLALTDSDYIDYDSSLGKITSQLSKLSMHDLKSTSTSVRLFPSSSRQIHVHLPHSPSKKLGLREPIRRSGGTGYRSAYARNFNSRLESSVLSPRAHWSTMY